EAAKEGRARLDPQYELNLRKAENELNDKRREQILQQRFGPLGASYFGTELKESAKKVENIPGSMEAISNARQALNEGMFTGSDAQIRQAWAKWANAMGFTYNEKTVPTDAFKAYLAPIKQQLRQT